MQPSWRMVRVCQALEQHYGVAKAWVDRDPLDVLVKVILSQNTTDVTSFKAFEELKQTYPSWEKVMAAPRRHIERIIRPAGLAPTKSKRIQEVLREIQRQRGELSLDFLHSLPTEQAKAWLTSLNGVGPKSAAIVLNFAFGRPEFPVDTHVYRVAGRLGFYNSDKVSREKAYRIMNGLCPDEHKTSCHVSLIRLGREVCTPGKPRCPLCPLQKACNYYQKKMKQWYQLHPKERREVLRSGIRKPHTSAIHGRWHKRAKGALRH